MDQSFYFYSGNRVDLKPVKVRRKRFTSVLLIVWEKEREREKKRYGNFKIIWDATTLHTSLTLAGLEKLSYKATVNVWNSENMFPQHRET